MKYLLPAVVIEQDPRRGVFLAGRLDLRGEFLCHSRSINITIIIVPTSNTNILSYPDNYLL